MLDIDLLVKKCLEVPSATIILQYGTAGFRSSAENLPAVTWRMGLLAALHSLAARGEATGLMITASHNPEADNGVKLVDPFGHMVSAVWENRATRLVTAGNNSNEIHLVLSEVLNDCDITVTASLLLGWDTRISSVPLSEYAKSGAAAVGATVRCLGEVTTPQLHYLLWADQHHLPSTLEDYYSRLATNFMALMNMGETKPTSNEMWVDCACGVGGPAIQKLNRCLMTAGGGAYLTLKACNLPGEGSLNHECGADWVKVQQMPPSSGLKLLPGRKCAVLDGDADRILYFYLDESQKFKLLDGDKIATLLTCWINNQLHKSNLSDKLRLGLVQTAYANSASTDFAHSAGVRVEFAATGVKHLHAIAEKEFDLGVYFEANGHGTLLYNDIAEQLISKNSEMLSIFLKLTNAAVGDALADLLLVEVVLSLSGWNLQQWDAQYTDLPNRQLKVRVKDRNVITTTDAERRCSTPAGLQAAIDQTVASDKSFVRSFVRPSGTEDIVRVYAEGKTQESADQLAREVARVVYKLAGGVGDSP